jgi:hypothetical protein
MPTYSDFNCTLSAYGMDTYGLPVDWSLRVTQVSYGLNIIGNEDQAAAFKTFYARQVQEDTFVILAMFINAAERRDFFTWYQAYAKYTTTPSPVGAMRCQVPARGFDFYGTLADGVVESTTVKDVAWMMSLKFVGAQPTVSLSSAYTSDNTVNGQPLYVPPSNDDVATNWFYPESPFSGPTDVVTDHADQTPSQAAGAVPVSRLKVSAV